MAKRFLNPVEYLQMIEALLEQGKTAEALALVTEGRLNLACKDTEGITVDIERP